MIFFRLPEADGVVVVVVDRLSRRHVLYLPDQTAAAPTGPLRSCNTGAHFAQS